MFKLLRPLSLTVALTGAMADQSQVLEAMVSQLTAAAAGFEALRVQGTAQTAANAETAEKLAEMQQCISQHDALLTGDGPSVLSAAAPVARPQDQEIRVPHGDAGSSQPVSREDDHGGLAAQGGPRPAGILLTGRRRARQPRGEDQHARARGPHA